MKEKIHKTIEVLKRGGIILYPTDTVWGLGCDATNSEAVDKIYKLKRSENRHSMLVLVYPLENIARYIHQVPEVAWQLLEVSDSPLTLILPNAGGVAKNLIPEDGTLGIRVPYHSFCSELIRRFGRPLVSTSANISTQPAPTTIDEVSQDILDGVDLVVDPSFDTEATKKPSSIISVGVSGEIKIIRQ